MITTSDTPRFSLTSYSAAHREAQSKRAWFAWFAGILLLTGLAGYAILKQMPGEIFAGWALFFLGVGAILYCPRYGIYLIVFWGLVGDAILAPWFPFVKGFSAIESLLYVSHSIIISPLEAYIIVTTLSWLARWIAVRNFKFFTGQMFWPVLIFAAFAIYGLVYGLATGGSSNIALWESRPIFHMIFVFFLTTNLIQKREHIKILIWVAIIAVFILGIAGDYFYLVTVNGNLKGIEAITEHASAIHMNTIFVFLLGSLIYEMSSRKRMVLFLFSIVIVIAFFADQRRAAFLSLFVAVAMFAVVLYIDKRKAFWAIVPAVTVIAVVYSAAFWNSSSKLALPVEAIKSVIAPNQISYRDQSSNLYRIVENVDSSFTIHSKPLTGVGFGQKFYMLVPLPDISFFNWWQYITHNSILWIWMKMGLGGFVSLLFMVGMAMVTGMRAYLRMPPGEYRAIALVATFYVMMHFIYAYVDMSWDSRSMIYVGAMIGMINCMEVVLARPVLNKLRRWPWQADPQPEPLILPAKSDD